MKFPREVPVVGWDKPNGTFYPNFAPAGASQSCVFFGILHVGYINEMRNIWNFQIFF